MRATLNIPDALLSEVQHFSGENSKTKAIVVAMEEFVKKKKLDKLLTLKGKVTIEYDWAAEEELELNAQKKREMLNGK